MSDTEEIEKSIDCVNDQEREYGQNALSDFQKTNYASCLQTIGKLESRTFDFKVAHNKAVVEYYKSDLKKTDQFQKNLNNIFNQFQMKLKKLDDVDHCVAHFNQALLLFHQSQYTGALRIIDRVYKFIEPMDDNLSKQVGLLMVELQLCIRQPDKALSFINYLQNHLINGNNQNVNMKISLKHIKQHEKEQKEVKALRPLSPTTTLFLKKLSKYRIRCYLLNHSLNSVKEEIQNLSSQDKQNVEYMFLLANQEYLLGNFQESIKILTSIPNECLKYSENGESSTVMFYNNMGVLHHALGKPNLACHYYQMALKQDVSFAANLNTGDKPVYILGCSRYHEIMYNLGISLLYAGHPVQAFECLVVAVRRYHRNSRLWLRLAECCVLIHKESNEIDFDIKRKQKEFVVQCIGVNEKQKVVLTSNLSRDSKYSAESQSYAVPVPTLEFASLCLRNAQLLLPSDTASSPVPLLLIPGVTPPAPPPSPSPAPSAPLCPESIESLRNTIFAASAYVSLCLGDYILTLENAEKLLKQSRISGIHGLLGHLYAAEALVLLDKISEALEHLNPEKVQSLSFKLPTEADGSSDDLPLKTEPPFKWFPNNMPNAVAVVQYNIAVAKTLRGQLDQAAALLKQIWQSKGPDCQAPAHVIMLVLYIELQLGHADVARSLIKQYSLQHRFC